MKRSLTLIVLCLLMDYDSWSQNASQYVFMMDTSGLKYKEFRVSEILSIEIETGVKYESVGEVKDGQFYAQGTRIPFESIDKINVKKVTAAQVASAPFYAASGATGAIGVISLVLYDQMDGDDPNLEVSEETEGGFLFVGLLGLASAGVTFLIGKLISPSSDFVYDTKNKQRSRTYRTTKFSEIKVFNDNSVSGMREYLRKNNYTN